MIPILQKRPRHQQTFTGCGDRDNLLNRCPTGMPTPANASSRLTSGLRYRFRAELQPNADPILAAGVPGAIDVRAKTCLDHEFEFSCPMETSICNTLRKDVSI